MWRSFKISDDRQLPSLCAPRSRSAAGRHCTFAVAGAEVPTRLVSVTVIEAMDCELPCWIVNGWVKVNWLPKGAAAALPKYCANIASTGTVSCVVCTVEPGAALNV